MYRVLHSDTKIEIRKYKPVKRTIRAFGREYYLQFPYFVAARSGNNLHVAFADDDVETPGGILVPSGVFLAPLPNVEETFVCLSDDKEFSDLDEMLRHFWCSDFNTWLGDDNYEQFERWFGGRFHNWQKMDLETVDAVMEPKMPWKKFLDRIQYDSLT